MFIESQIFSYIILTTITTIGLVLTGWVMCKIYELKNKIHFSSMLQQRKQLRKARKEKEFREKYRIG